MKTPLAKLTIRDIAARAKLGTATVDRVLNGREGVRPQTRERVIRAIEELQASQSAETRNIACVVKSGPTFISMMKQGVDICGEEDEGRISWSFDGIPTQDQDHGRVAELILERAEQADGLIVIGPDVAPVNRAVTQVEQSGTPVICLSNDLPRSGRTAYVGIDQISAGATAGYLMGRMLPPQPGRILMVISGPYHSQYLREMGFRRVLRSDFPLLELDEQVNAQDESEYAYQRISEYLQSCSQPPAGIYNPSGGNRGIARALREYQEERRILFIGHEVNAHTRELLDSRQMDIVINHDVQREIRFAAGLIEQRLDGRSCSDIVLPVAICTPHTSL